MDLLIQLLHLLIQIVDDFDVLPQPLPLVNFIPAWTHVVEASGCEKVEELDERSVLEISVVGYSQGEYDLSVHEPSFEAL